MEGFSFPSLPQPRPLSEAVRSKNPLLARATVVDARAAASSSGSGSAGVAAAEPYAYGSGADGPAAADMGGALGKPVVLSRHQRVAPMARRKKVPFEIGHSQMDWVRLTQSGADLAGLDGACPRRDISLDEVGRHRTADDCWTVLQGKVYNLTPYMQFHPGGAAILMAVAGKDGTALFNKHHAWVNAEFMLAKCLVGWVAAAPRSSSSDHRSTSGEADAQDQQQQVLVPRPTLPAT